MNEQEKDVFEQLEDEIETEEVIETEVKQKQSPTPEDSKKVFWGRKNLNEKIIFVTGMSLLIIFLIVAILGRYIFPIGSPLYEISVDNIGKFFDVSKFFQTKYPKMIETVAIIVFLWVLFKILQLIIHLITFKGNRSVTIGKLFTSILKYTISIVGLFLILSSWGVETPTLLASAGIIGLAISFGAQSLIADVLAGLFIIFEKQFIIGDIIQVGDFRGEVIEIGIRVTKFVDILGDTKIINNSEIRSVINTTSNYSPVICDVSLSHSIDLLEVEQVVNSNLARIKEAVPRIKEGPWYRGVSDLGADGVTIRIYARTLELDKYQAKRDIYREIKLIFDENKINIPHQKFIISHDDE